MQIALTANGLKEFFVVSLTVIDHWGKYEHFLTRIFFENKVNDLVIGVLHHLLARDVGVGIRSTRKEQTEVVVHLSYSANSRARIA